MENLKVLRRPYRPDTILVDGNALAFRSLYAQEHLSVRISGKQVFTGMAYGFLRKLAEIKNKFEPKNFVVVWDGGSKRKREIFPEYKKNRKIRSSKMSKEDIFASLDSCRKITKLVGIQQYRIYGEEGDDIIASYVAQHKEEIILVATNDHDMFQLLKFKHVKILKFKQKENDNLFCRARFIREHQGLLPQYYPHFLSIAGDSTDEIPGIKGLGDVKTLMLLLQVNPPTLKNLFNNIASIEATPHVKGLLENGKQEAFKFLKITKLKEDLNLEPLEEAKLRKKKLVAYLKKLKFRSILENNDAMGAICSLGLRK